MFKSKTGFLFPCMVASLFLCGCGSAEYEARLNETAAYYTFLNARKANLGPNWKSSGEITGLELQPPIGFKAMPAPEVELDEDGNPLSIEEDARQPMNIARFYDGELPGLAGCFTKTVKVDVGDSGSSNTTKIYLYVLARESINSEPGDFFDEVIGQLVVDLNAVQPDESDWDEQSYPTIRKYVEPTNYQIVTITAGNPINELGEKQTDVEVYMTSGEDKDVVLLYFIPNSGMGRKDSTALAEGRKFSLQSLEITKSKSPAGEGPPSPGSSTPNF